MAGQVSAQLCSFTINGSVKSAADSSALPYSSIQILNLEKTFSTDLKGNFKIIDLCKRTYILEVSSVGYKTKTIEVDLETSMILNIILEEFVLDINPAEVISYSINPITATDKIGATYIAERLDKNLAQMLTETPGVSVIQNGNGISKPVIHGNFGNRIAILNNGVTQSGQQWGADHSPEIDPLTANAIYVVKGVSALEYLGNSLGGVVLVKPKYISRDSILHGAVRYLFKTNGRGHGINAELSKSNGNWGFSLVGTLHKQGDAKTPEYFLNNTGYEQANFAFQLKKQISPRLSSSMYLSSFNANYGVLRGSHIGNLTDLESALQREIPFFTEPNFSYKLEAPHQRVNHQLAKVQLNYSVSQNLELEANYAFQWNLRKEFDIRRSGRSEIPAMNISQNSNFLEIKPTYRINLAWQLSSGVQLNRTDNLNDAETGILPLIPDYVSRELGVFSTLKRMKNERVFEVGGRVDIEDRRVAAISRTIPREIVRFSNVYQNYSAVIGYKTPVLKNYTFSYNIGLASRNPEVNELYSSGLHQGVSGIEEGDSSLETETAWKQTVSLESEISPKFRLELLGYSQHFENYIYLLPTDEVQLTIRGAFPVFRYQQTSASILGLDGVASYDFSNNIRTQLKYSYLKGMDRANSRPLVFMPSNRISSSITYIKEDLGHWKNFKLNLNSEYVFEQTNILPNQDFMTPPKGYVICGLSSSIEKKFEKFTSKFFLRVENMFNTIYRDYLNRQRYFADDLGRNLVLGINLEF